MPAGGENRDGNLGGDVMDPILAKVLVLLADSDPGRLRQAIDDLAQALDNEAMQRDGELWRRVDEARAQLAGGK